MRRKRFPRRWLAAVGAIIVWAVVMWPLLSWGLPSTSIDPLLFAGQSPWEPAAYEAGADLAERRARNAGADTDLDPLRDREHIVDLTATHVDRADILRRYRLYSRQPDEMITFLALARMQPRALDFDPKLYQYGGGYIYLIGAALGTAHVLGLAHLTGDINHYLQNPDAFATFYIVARFVSLTFGGLTLLAAYKFGRRTSGSVAGWLAMLLVALLPAFISGVLEAKPHVPSACLIMWATLSALDTWRNPDWGPTIRLGLQAGYAFGLVLTGIAAALLWPVPLLFCGSRRQRMRLVVAGIVAAAVYVVTNPYVIVNAFGDDGGLTSNMSNSTAMYAGQAQHALTGIVRVGALLWEAAGGAAFVGLAGLAMLAWATPRRALMVALPSLAVIVLGVLLAAGKPAEFARFLILPAVMLATGAACLIATVVRPPRRSSESEATPFDPGATALKQCTTRRASTTDVVATRRRSAGNTLTGLLLLILAIIPLRSAAYVRSFAIDAHEKHESRRTAARYLLETMSADDRLGVIQEPAPYAVPPIDFVRRTVVWLPAQRPGDFAHADLPRWLVYTADDGSVYADAWWQSHYSLVQRCPATDIPISPITWANKPVFICQRLDTARAE